jgi:hypothetical protein
MYSGKIAVPPGGGGIREKTKIMHSNACFTILCHSTDFDDQSNLSPIVHL